MIAYEHCVQIGNASIANDVKALLSHPEYEALVVWQRGGVVKVVVPAMDGQAVEEVLGKFYLRCDTQTVLCFEEKEFDILLPRLMDAFSRHGLVLQEFYRENGRVVIKTHNELKPGDLALAEAEAADFVLEN